MAQGELKLHKQPRDGPIPLHLATGNPGKVREFRQILKPLGYKVMGLEDLGIDLEVDEDGDTFAANAIKKAAALGALTGAMTLADDSGLAVDALDGAPGVHSARYAADLHGEGWRAMDRPTRDAHNRRKLIAALDDVEEGHRGGRFVCALALWRPDHEPVVFEGTFEGEIRRQESGEGGFGYDSIFGLIDDPRTSAELSPEEKNARSHRGKAISQLVFYLREGDQ